MSNDGEIPEDVLAVAIDVNGHVRAIAYAILDAVAAERERCAKACEFRADALAKIPGYRSEVAELRARAAFIRTGE